MERSKQTTLRQIEDLRREIEREKQTMSGGKKKPGNINRAPKVAEWILFGCVASVLAIVLLSVQTAKNRGEIPNIMGFYIFRIESGSMKPTFDVGALIICRKADGPGSLEEGDIVTFSSSSGDIVTHRIIEVWFEEDGAAFYRTKGDNPANSPDPELLTPDRVIAVFTGKVPLT